MYGIKSRDGRWSVCLCNCSRDTVHFHYGDAVVHILLEDLGELGRAMQSVADGVEDSEENNPTKKGWVQ
jgi:hypothetical protein